MVKPSLSRMISGALALCFTTATAVSAQTFTTLIDFDGTNGSGPRGSLVQGVGGNLFGTTSAGSGLADGTVFKVSLKHALHTLHKFCGQENCVDGAVPLGGLVQISAGIFYGTTSAGGANDS